MSNQASISHQELVEFAREARGNAYAPYSNYKVGAALIADGELYCGANIEVSGRSTSVHAEMLAAFSAVFNGATNFEVLAVSPDGETGKAPCGLCQHTLAEFCDDLLILEDLGGSDFVSYTLDELIGPAYRPRHRDHD